MNIFTNTKKSGFTLIEILVVVLILSILSAIALPDYRRSVERARASEAMTIMRAVYDACERLGWEKGYEENACQSAINANQVTFAKLDVMVKGSYGDNGLSLTTNNFKYTLSGTSTAVVTAQPVAGPYATAKIEFDGGRFSCPPIEGEGEAAKACKIWGSDGWNVE